MTEISGSFTVPSFAAGLGGLAACGGVKKSTHSFILLYVWEKVKLPAAEGAGSLCSACAGRSL